MSLDINVYVEMHYNKEYNYSKTCLVEETGVIKALQNCRLDTVLSNLDSFSDMPGVYRQRIRHKTCSKMFNSVPSMIYLI